MFFSQHPTPYAILIKYFLITWFKVKICILLHDVAQAQDKIAEIPFGIFWY